MADILVSDSVKPKLISLLDFVPDEINLRHCFQFYPGEIPLRKKLLEDIITVIITSLVYGPKRVH